MTVSFEGKVAVLTGASRNIGKAVAIELVKRGCKVVIGDILDDIGAQTVDELNKLAGTKVAVYLRTDVRKYADNISLFKLAEEKFGGVDEKGLVPEVAESFINIVTDTDVLDSYQIAFLNAGIGSNANAMFLPLNDEVDDQMCDINTTAVIKGTKVAMLHMAKRGGGVIINTASVAGFVPSCAVGIYVASKHGVIGWTRSCEIFKEVCNVRVNALCPWWVATDLKDELANSKHMDPYAKTASKAKLTDMDTVVKAVMLMIEDETLNGATMLALPDGVIRPQEKIPIMPEILSPEYVEAVQRYTVEAIPYYKNQLAEAMARYGF